MFAIRVMHHCTTLATLTVLALTCLPLRAQTDLNKSESELQNERRDRLIEQLEARVEELERIVAAGAQTGDEPPQAAVASVAETTQSAPQQPPAVADVEDQRLNGGVPLHAFADVGYVHASAADGPNGSKSGFVIGNLDLYMAPRIAERIKALFELNFEYDRNGVIGEDVERAQISYTFSDALTVWAGRFHTPFGYWNTAYHHGAQLETSVDRPLFLDFEDEDGIMPVHTVGLWGTGAFRLGDGQVTYDVYVGNGDRIANGELDFNAELDDNGNRELGFRLAYRFGDEGSGLLLGVDGLSQDVNAAPDIGGSHLIDMKFLGGYAVYDANNWELMAEYYRFLNRDASNADESHRSWAGYLQVGYILGGRFTPYARYEAARLDQFDPYFAALAGGRSYTCALLGLRYDLSAQAALKLEFERLDRTRDGGARSNRILSQFAIRF